MNYHSSAQGGVEQGLLIVVLLEFQITTPRLTHVEVQMEKQIMVQTCEYFNANVPNYYSLMEINEICE